MYLLDHPTCNCLQQAALDALYNWIMARGWESKSVESQMEDAKGTQPDGAQRPLTDAERHKKRERENMRLARARILQQLEAATNDRYKELLRQELTALEKRINGG